MKPISLILILAVWLTLTVAQRIHAQCQYIPAASESSDILTYDLSGGTFASYGCKPIDPTYWVSGSTGGTMKVTFTTPASNPSLRVWGMNDDDTAAISVNGSYYPLTPSSASYGRKVVCGTSPGPDGVSFVHGKLVGVNSNSDANFSYQDITIRTSDVSTIVITAESGNGWGFAGVSVDCPEVSAPTGDTRSGADPEGPKPKQ
jgi:hypothetical protein